MLATTILTTVREHCQAIRKHNGAREYLAWNPCVAYSVSQNMYPHFDCEYIFWGHPVVCTVAKRGVNKQKGIRACGVYSDWWGNGEGVNWGMGDQTGRRSG